MNLDQQTSTFKVDHSPITNQPISITINNETFKISSDFEFIYQSQPWLLYQHTTSVRQHQAPTDYHDQCIDVYAIIRQSDAKKYCRWVFNLLVNKFVCKQFPIQDSAPIIFKQTIEEIKNDFLSLSIPNQSQATLDCTHLLAQAIDQLNYDQLCDGILASDFPLREFVVEPNQCKQKLCNNNCTLSFIMKSLTAYLEQYIRFAPTLIPEWSITNIEYYLYSILQMCLTHKSIINLAIPPQQIFIHQFMTCVMDILSDKSTKILFGEGGNPRAREILKQIYIKHPHIQHVRHPNAVTADIQHQLTQYQNYKVALFPYLLSLNFGEKTRIEYNYNHIKQHLTKINNLNFRLPETSELWPKIILPLSNNLPSYGYYSIETLMSIIGQFMTLPDSDENT